MKFQVLFDDGDSTMHVSFTFFFLLIQFRKTPISLGYHVILIPQMHARVQYTNDNISTDAPANACFPHAPNVKENSVMIKVSHAGIIFDLM